MDSYIEGQDFIPNDKKDNQNTMIARLDKDKNVLEFPEIKKDSGLPADCQVKIIDEGLQMSVLQNYINANSHFECFSFRKVKLLMMQEKYFPNQRYIALYLCKNALVLCS